MLRPTCATLAALFVVAIVTLRDQHHRVLLPSATTPVVAGSVTARTAVRQLRFALQGSAPGRAQQLTFGGGSNGSGTDGPSRPDPPPAAAGAWHHGEGGGADARAGRGGGAGRAHHLSPTAARDRGAMCNATGATVAVTQVTGLEEDEASYRRCCAARWRAAWAANVSALCDPLQGARAPSSLECTHTPTGQVWFCRLRRVALDLSTARFDTVDYGKPTISNTFRWPPGALRLRGCRLSSAFTRRLIFGKVLGHILPGAVTAAGLEESDEEEAGGWDGARVAGAAGVGAPDEPGVVTVLLVRVSPKNFWLGHYDFLQVFSILHVLGVGSSGDNDAAAKAAQAKPAARGLAPAAGGRRRVRLVLVPPDKANARPPFWGPHRLLWEALSDEPVRTLADLEEVERAGGRQSSGGKRVWLSDAVIGLSGLHSNYGRGIVGRALEATCNAPCAGRGAYAAVSAFYRGFVGSALASLGALAYARPSAPVVRILWISRGKGLGGRYTATVHRRCLNEVEVCAAVHSRTPHALRMVDFAAVPFKEQLTELRGADVLTGMHGAGYTNMVFLPPHAAVAELCPKGYCTNSFERLAARLGLAYLRWTNRHPENAKDNYDTVVHVDEFLDLLGRAADRVLATLQAQAQTRGRSGTSHGAAPTTPAGTSPGAGADEDEDEGGRGDEVGG